MPNFILKELFFPENFYAQYLSARENNRECKCHNGDTAGIAIILARWASKPMVNFLRETQVTTRLMTRDGMYPSDVFLGRCPI